MTRIDKIKEALESMSTTELIDVHNEYCDAINDGDSRIYSMDEFDEILSCMSPWEVARAAYYSGKFCPANGWFWFNGYANLESSDFTPDIIFVDDIAAYIDRNDDALYNGDVQDILDEWEEDAETA